MQPPRSYPCSSGHAYTSSSNWVLDSLWKWAHEVGREKWWWERLGMNWQGGNRVDLIKTHYWHTWNYPIIAKDLKRERHFSTWKSLRFFFKFTWTLVKTKSEPVLSSYSHVHCHSLSFSPLSLSLSLSRRIRLSYHSLSLCSCIYISSFLK